MGDRVGKILTEYDKNKNINNAFTEKLRSFTHEILSLNNIHVHTLTSRVKERSSLEKKVNKKEEYSSLDQITDICGIRITTYYEDDIAKVADLIKENFKIDYVNSVNKKESLDPSTFGYLSLHYIISFNEEREKLVEYKRFINLKAEIQIRTILQHAWAEIEHDLGYKSKVPNPIRRRFSMLAGLLELADREFIHIKEDLMKYEHDLPEQIKFNPKDVKIDKLSLKQFLMDNRSINEINKYLLDGSIASEILKEDLNIDGIVNQLDYLDIPTISSLATLLDTYKSKIKKLLKLIFPDEKPRTLKRTIGVYYLNLILLAENCDVDEFLDNYKNAVNINIYYDDDADKYFIDAILKVANE